LSNAEQRDSWLNSGHWTLAADSIVVVYLNDILIFTKTKKEHAQAV